MEKKHVQRLLIIVLALNLFVSLAPIKALGDKIDSENVLINEINFPDEKFRLDVKEQFDNNNNNILEKNEIDEVTEIVLSNYSTKTLKGIEFFSKINKLLLENLSITSLDLSNNKELSVISCKDTNLTAIDTSALPELEIFNMEKNNIKNLDISHNLKLKEINCYIDQLDKLDVTKNIDLLKLSCKGRNLKSIDISNNINLTSLNYSESKIVDIDISKNIALTELNCSHTGTSKLDLSNNINLESINCERTNITNLDISKNKKLKTLHFGYTGVDYLDFSLIPEIEKLSFGNTKITNIDVSCLPKLLTLRCSDTQINKLDLNKNLLLEDLYCEDTGVLILDVTKNTKLKILDCSNLKISKLDLSKNLELTNLTCENNPNLTILDLSKNQKLKYIDCSSTPISKLGKLNYKELDSLDIGYCKFSFFDMPRELSKYFTSTLGNQAISQPASFDKKSNKFTLDFKSLVPDLKRVIVEESGEYTYDKNTGILTFKDKPDKVIYKYSARVGEKYPQLEATVTIDQKANPINVRSKVNSNKDISTNNDLMPTWAIIVIILISVSAASIVGYFVYKKMKNKK